MFIAGAIIGSAVIGGITSYMGAEAQANAASTASNATLAATRETNALTREMWQQGREDVQPWVTAGTAALDRLAAQPDFAFTPSEFKFMEDPGYQFRLEQGIGALDKSAAARGNILSGGQAKAVTNYASDLASQEYANAFNRWQSEESNRFSRELSTYNANEASDRYLASAGQASATGQAAAGGEMAQAIGANTMAGTAAANQTNMAAANAIAQGYSGMATSANQGIQNYLLSKYLVG